MGQIGVFLVPAANHGTNRRPRGKVHEAQGCTIIMVLVYIYVLHYALLLSLAASIKVSIFGASGGIGQLVTKRLVELNVEVNAITRSAAETREKFGLNLAGSAIIQADAREIATIPNTINDVDFIVLTMGTYSPSYYYSLTHLLTYSFRHYGIPHR